MEDNTLEGLKPKAHGVRVSVVSHSFGEINQITSVDEGASTPDELVYKHQLIADEVIAAMNGDNSADTGGVLRRMGEQFQAAMKEAGGDLQALMTKAPWKTGEAKQGRVKGKKS